MTHKTISKILIFEGLDRSGKTSLRRQLLNYTPDQMTIDRLVVSQLVYNTFFNRHDHDETLAEIIKTLRPYSIIVYVKCSYDEYLKRCRDTTHNILSLHDFEYQSMLFDNILHQIDYDTIVIDTTGLKEEESCAKLITELQLSNTYR